MNNSKIAIEHVSLVEEESFDSKPLLRQRETELIEILEALEHISGSKYWEILLNKVFNKDFTTLQIKLENEKNPTEIYRLQGEIKRSRTLNLEKKLQAYSTELQNVRKLLNAN